MNELKVGDVVYLKSYKMLYMTVVWAGNNEIQCAYFNGNTQTFEKVKFPINAVIKVG